MTHHLQVWVGTAAGAERLDALLRAQSFFEVVARERTTFSVEFEADFAHLILSPFGWVRAYKDYEKRAEVTAAMVFVAHMSRGRKSLVDDHVSVEVR